MIILRSKRFVLLSGFFTGCLLSFLISKNKNRVTFVCNEAGLFGGNIRALFSHAFETSKNTHFNIVTSSRETHQQLKTLGFDSKYYPSVGAVWSLLRSKLVIVECGLRIELCGICAFGNVVQLWHGANLKYMVKEWYTKQPSEKNLKQLIYWIKINVPKYTFILSPSTFYMENTFRTSFNSHEVFVAGYPRNDLFFRSEKERDYWGSSSEIVKKAKLHLENKGKVVVYCPTWRDKGNFIDNVIPFHEEKLINFLKKNNILLVVKKHHRDPRQLISQAHPLVEIYPHDKDVYLLLKHSSLLVTDYSSIFFDYLLLDKPVIFYTFDYDIYVERDRSFQCSYDDFTPGKKCQNEDELYVEIESALGMANYYAEERHKMKTLAFDSIPCSDSSDRVWQKCLQFLC